MKIYGTSSFREFQLRPENVMLVKYTSVNELMVVKVNVKIVSTMLNEVRSILADTLEAEKLLAPC